jgi:hypothetical protein
MARPPLDPPSDFARLVSSAIRREMGERMMSVASLSRRLDKSPKYARERLRDNFEFTLADIERFCQFIGVYPEDFIGAIERQSIQLPDLDLPEARAVSLREVLDSDPREDNEGYEDGDGEDEYVGASKDDVDLVANHSIDERPRETDADFDNA